MKTFLIKPGIILTGVCLLLGTPLSPAESGTPDAAEISGIAEQFHNALSAGQPDKVIALLQPDALIVEGGTVQTRAEYKAEHLGEDIAYVRAVPGKQVSVVVRQEGDVAWVTSTFRVTGKFHDQAVDSLAAETMILHRTAEGWRIRAIHWSSQKASASH